MEDDILLVRRVLQGDRSAFRQLVESYQQYVFTIAHNVLKNREEAEEVAQDVFLKVYKMLGSYRQESKFSSWLYAVAYRSAIDASRRKKLPAQSLEKDGTELPIPDLVSKNSLENLQDQELSTWVHGAVQTLKPQDATIVTLFYLNEQPVSEIAKITGLSITNVKTKLHRLREQLREDLAPQYHKLFGGVSNK
jgi:RNA polymerase sigma factor (sigma-70 family)